MEPVSLLSRTLKYWRSFRLPRAASSALSLVSGGFRPVLSNRLQMIRVCKCELFIRLKARLNDSNKNLVMMTLATLGVMATTMGLVVEKHSKGILADALKCLGDNKKVVREAVLKMLDSWV